MENKNNISKSVSSTDKITRKQAIKKAGVTALTAASLVFLSTQASAKSSKTKPTRPGRIP
jgi:hypothetical protein